MTSRAARRAKKRSITLPGAETATQPRGPGRPATEDAHRKALGVRAARLGYPDTADGRRAVSGPEFGCAVGQAIMASGHSKDGKADLWQAVCHMRRVWLAYDRAIGAPARHAKCLAILAPTEAMTADAASPAPDLRSPEDRARQAVAAYMRLRGWLGHVDGAVQSFTIRVVIDEPDEGRVLWGTVHRALLCVVDGIKGRKVIMR